MKNTLKWKPASIVYPTDHLISSKAREVGAWGFKPQYESAKHVNMRFLMSNEYMRLWFKERELYQKENYSKQEKARNEAHLKRGFVQRMMTNPKLHTRELPTIQLKRFQNIISKVDNRRTEDEKIKICERYKKTVEPVELTRYKPTCPAHKMKAKSEANKKKIGKKKTSTKKDQDQEGSSQSSPVSGGQCQLVCKLI
ncbi:unnamed protein product [Tenebrio molitor]|nr:unnamed protein product [Tenebrio molitor]